MPRIPRLVVLVFFLVTLSASAAQLVAPRPLFTGPLPYEDREPESVSNGETTLIAWTNAFSPYGGTHRVYVRMLDGGEGILLGSGTGPRVATNGRDYLVAHSIGFSRFPMYPYDNVAVQLVSSDGRPGLRRIINHSLSGYAGGVAWNGEHWLVGYSKDQYAIVALLDANLNRVATIEAGLGFIPQIVNIAGTTWAFLHSYNQPAEAVEIRRDGTAGRRHTLTTSSQSLEIVPTDDSALALLGTEKGTEVATFDPASGFSAVSLLAERSMLRDAKPWHGGAAVVTVHADTTATELFAVNADGTITGRVVLRTSGSIHTPRHLGESKDGLLYFEQVDAGGIRSWDLYMTRLAGLQLAQTAELISTGNLAYQLSPLIAANDRQAVAFWTSYVNGEVLPVSSRGIDDSGQPFGTIAELATIPTIDDIAFDGQQFIAVWSRALDIYAATITADGQRAGMPMLLGTGEFPEIASTGSATFVVWSNAGKLYGTNVHADATAAIPGGFGLLPGSGETNEAPGLAAVDDGFVVAWSNGGVRSAILTDRGAILRELDLIAESRMIDIAGGNDSALALVLRPGSNALYTFSSGGDPIQALKPDWGNWWPLSVTWIHDDDPERDRYLVTIRRDELFFTSEVTVQAGSITGITPLRVLGDAAASVTTVNGTPLALTVRGDGVYVATGPEVKRRGVRAR